MSGAVSVEDYTLVFIWLAICSIYTTLLTFTALGVVFVIRKRRSSILKSQRPPRTPFSELEFNVATPTDTAKSRRVSFSRRTGVAEFITNEATTTWKNFYEEHNKSHESSGNESAANAPRPIGHIGKRIFDQQFQEEEAVDFGSTIDNHPNRNINTSINNVNFTQQLASLECTGDDRKLSVPQQNFEMSAFTDHQSKLFGDDFAIPTTGEMSGHIDVNFSAVQTIGEVKDDLDEIQNDLQRAQSNVVCPGPFSGRRSLSEYIEVDLNATHVTVKNDDDDMSITDTIHSPKVQDVSKNHSSIQIDKKASFSKDWVADKENIVLNPYVTPKESTNFAVNDHSDKVLVFDGKRLTIQSDKEADIILKGNTSELQPKVPKEPRASQKNIVLNVNDDLPNFFEDPLMLTSNTMLSSASFKHSLMCDDDDDLTNDNKPLEKLKPNLGNDPANIPITQSISSNIMPSEKVPKELQSNKTINYDDINADVSMTQAISSKIIGPQEKVEPQKRRTIVFENDNGDISITQAIPANILLNKKKPEAEPERRRTILYENDMGNISITQAIPANIIFNENKEVNKQEPERRRTIIYDNDISDISMTQAIPANIILNERKEGNTQEREKRRTIIFDNDMSNISITQAIPANIILNEKKDGSKEGPERRRTIIYDNDLSNISMTQAIPANIILIENKDSSKQAPERRRTILYDNDMSNISMTQAIPANILLNVNKDGNNHEPERRKTVIYDDDLNNISMTQAIPANIILNEQKDVKKQEPERRRTIIYDDDMSNISVTQAIPANIILNEQKDGKKQEPERRRTIIYDDDMDNISITQAIPANIIFNETNEGSNKTNSGKRKTIIYDGDMSNVSVTKPILPNIIDIDKSKTLLYNNMDTDISMMQALPTNLLLNDIDLSPEGVRRKTIVFESEEGDISVTKVLPSNILIPEEKSKSERNSIFKTHETISHNVNSSQCIHPNTKFTTKSTVEDEKSRSVVNDKIVCNISFTRTSPAKVLLPAEDELDDKINIVASDTDIGDTSINRDVPTNITVPNEKRKTIVYEDEAGNISITNTLPSNVFWKEKSGDSKKDLIDKIDILASVSNSGHTSITSTVPTDIIHSSEKCERMLHVQNACNVSVTHTSPTKVFGAENYEVSQNNAEDRINIIASETGVGDISSTSAVTIPKEKCQTIVYKDEAGNISVTSILPSNSFGAEKSVVLDKRKTVLNQSTTQDISVAKAVLVNVVIVNNAAETRKSVKYDTQTENALAEKSKIAAEEDNMDSESGDLSDIQNSPKHVIESNTAEKDFNNDENMSPIHARPTDLVPEDKFAAEDNRITSSDSLIYIIRDTEDETQTDKTDDHKNKSLTWKTDVPRIQHSPLSLEYKEDIDEEVTADLPKKLDELKSIVKDKSPHINRHYEKMISSDLESEKLDKSESQDRFEISKGGKSFKDANDTNELLEMLSDLTDRRSSKAPEKPTEKIEPNEPRRLSVAPNRLSIVLSREDLLNNISMAQAALQRSIEIDESIDDTTSDTPPEVSLPHKKAVRVSNEVVKKLQFEEDESASDASIKSDMKGSPLKKTAFGEMSYMKENKAKVIPSYLKDVSDDIKALMNDLVKPNADSLTYQMPPADTSLKRDPSTCSTQIQANLITSSQIDLDTELNSVADSVYDLGKTANNRSHSQRSFVKSPDVEAEEISFRPKRDTSNSPSQDRVIVFDHYNPLNNILLVPIDCSEAHKYNPHKSNETLCADSNSVHSTKQGERIDIINTQVVGSVTVQHAMQPSGDSVPDKSDAQSLLSNTSKPTSIDEAVSTPACETKDTKVNTLIAMKANKELLEASSSLTLVDDALAQNAFDVDLDMVTADSSTTNAQDSSPVKVIYHNEDQDALLSEKASDFTSADEMMEPVKSTKGKKRNYSPTKKDKHKQSTSSLDVTPKPISKMQKISNSPKCKPNEEEESLQKLMAEDILSKSAMDVEESADTKKSPKRSPRKTKKPGTSVTVQQLLTKYDMHTDIDQKALSKQIIETLSRSDSSTAPNTISQTDIETMSPDAVSSYTSSKNQIEMKEALSVVTAQLSNQSKSGKMEWQPDKDVTNIEAPECESSVNVVAKIDMLPFMGSHECEWEASGTDTWSFRLLHGRIRLCVRLAHRHDNAARTRVRADTSVNAVVIETAHADKKNSVATLCVGFALETMRYFVGRGCGRAGDVPGLLRRCAGVARVALRWGRAMHDARLHLAYSLADDGRLALKVANIPLRSVWEVTMRLELVVEDAREVPWPRACDVQVSRVVSDVHVHDDEVRRALSHLPRDWGHAPRAVWKIFRYLKNKTREDDLLGL